MTESELELSPHHHHSPIPTPIPSHVLDHTAAFLLLRDGELLKGRNCLSPFLCVLCAPPTALLCNLMLSALPALDKWLQA